MIEKIMMIRITAALIVLVLTVQINTVYGGIQQSNTTEEYPECTHDDYYDPELQRCVMKNLPSPEAVAAAQRALDSRAALMSGSGDAMFEAMRMVMNDPNNPANWQPPNSDNEQDNEDSDDADSDGDNSDNDKDGDGEEEDE